MFRSDIHAEVIIWTDGDTVNYYKEWNSSSLIELEYKKLLTVVDQNPDYKMTSMVQEVFFRLTH